MSSKIKSHFNKEKIKKNVNNDKKECFFNTSKYNLALLRRQRNVYVITFGSGKQLFPGLTATGINSVRGALSVEIIDSLHFKL